MDSFIGQYCMDIEYDLSFKQRPAFIDQMNSGVDSLKNKLTEDLDIEQKAHCYFLIGKFKRVLGELEESNKYLDSAYNIFKDAKNLKMLVNTCLNLGLTLIYKQDFIKGDKVLKKSLLALDSCSSKVDDELRDEILFALGLSKYWQGVKFEAVDYFQESLELRVVKGDLDLIDLTKSAIARVS